MRRRPERQDEVVVLLAVRTALAVDAITRPEGHFGKRDLYRGGIEMEALPEAGWT